MKEKWKILINHKYFHFIVILVFIVAILFILGVTVLKYHVEGETNMPFMIDKISVISSSDGIDKESEENKWAFSINQNNDIYLYLDKNPGYGKEEVIEKVTIDNILVQKEKEAGEIKIYRPDSEEEKMIFKNQEKNEAQEITFLGDEQSNLNQLQVSNQGGIVAFRFSNYHVAEYGTDDEEINHQELLSKTDVTYDMLKAHMQFDVSIWLASGTGFKTTISLDLPNEILMEKGIASEEITDVNSFVFKRIRN